MVEVTLSLRFFCFMLASTLCSAQSTKVLSESGNKVELHCRDGRDFSGTLTWAKKVNITSTVETMIAVVVKSQKPTVMRFVKNTSRGGSSGGKGDIPFSKVPQMKRGQCS